MEGRNSKNSERIQNCPGRLLVIGIEVPNKSLIFCWLSLTLSLGRLCQAQEVSHIVLSPSHLLYQTFTIKKVV